jgi:hypothetical protein
VSLRAVLLCVCGFSRTGLDPARRGPPVARRRRCGSSGRRRGHEIRIEALRVLFGCDLKTGRLDRRPDHGEAALALAREAATRA